MIDPTPDRPLIINLPATVEMATPNVYADSIEWMHRNLPRRDSRSCCACTRTTTAAPRVAAAELGVLAGADRVEGCLFGNGERTGNVDLVTLGLNLFSQGIDPQIDFSRHRRDQAHRRVLQPAARARAAPVRRRPGLHRVLRLAPGRDQEGPRRAGTRRRRRPASTVDEFEWGVPYLPIDPKDVGRTLRGRHPGQLAVRQGRRGVHHEGGAPPRPAAPAADRVLRRGPAATPTTRAARSARSRCGTSSPASTWSTTSTFGALALERYSDGHRGRQGRDRRRGRLPRRRARPIDRRRQRPDRRVRARAAAAAAIDVRVLDYAEHALSAGGDAQAAAYVECEVDGADVWGVGHRREHRHRLDQGRDQRGQPRPLSRSFRAPSGSSGRRAGRIRHG